jgi:Uma2 family endonuclease
MSTASPPAQGLLTAEEFARRPDPGYPEELVKGRIISMPLPGARHGQICCKVGRFLGNHADDHDLGHVLSNDSGTVTERGPDSVRGPDVSFYSYAKLPKGPLPVGYPAVPPDLVVEVLSPHDRWPKVLAKVVEYLTAGVAVVGVVDPERQTLHLYEGEQPVRILGADDELTLPNVLGDFRMRVGRLFDE